MRLFNFFKWVVIFSFMLEMHLYGKLEFGYHILDIFLGPPTFDLELWVLGVLVFNHILLPVFIMFLVASYWIGEVSK